MAEEGRLVRGEDGWETDARTLAAQIGLAKAMRKHKLRRVISFHSSVSKAERFANAAKEDSFPSVVAKCPETRLPRNLLMPSVLECLCSDRILIV